LGLAHSVPRLDHPAGRFDVDPHAAAESPVFQKMKDEGTTSKAPLTEAFGQWKNAKWVHHRAFGRGRGQAVVWYTGQFYALFFLEKMLKVDGATANILIAIALWPSARRSSCSSAGCRTRSAARIIMAGCALAALTYFPLFRP
jgi:hypothetical protein